MTRNRPLQLTGRRRHNDSDNLPFIWSHEELWRLNWKAEGFPYCGVYVVTTDSLYPCKIGISQNPTRRLSSLQTSHWRQLQITEYRWCQNETDAKAVEKAAHRSLKEQGKLLLGEWFNVRPEEAAETIDWVGLIESIEVNKHIPEEIKDEFEMACQEQHRKKFLKVGTGYD